MLDCLSPAGYHSADQFYRIGQRDGAADNRLAVDVARLTLNVVRLNAYLAGWDDGFAGWFDCPEWRADLEADAAAADAWANRYFDAAEDRRYAEADAALDRSR